MDINILRSIVTVVSLTMFLLIVAWAWTKGNQRAFEQAAQLPFQDDEHPPA